MACTPRYRLFRLLRGEGRGTQLVDRVVTARAREVEPSRLFCCADRRALRAGTCLQRAARSPHDPSREAAVGAGATHFCSHTEGVASPRRHGPGGSDKRPLRAPQRFALVLATGRLESRPRHRRPPGVPTTPARRAPAPPQRLSASECRRASARRSAQQKSREGGCRERAGRLRQHTKPKAQSDRLDFNKNPKRVKE